MANLIERSQLDTFLHRTCPRKKMFIYFYISKTQKEKKADDFTVTTIIIFLGGPTIMVRFVV